MNFAGSHILSFDRNTIPFEKVITWFNAPGSDDEYAVGNGNESFPLDDLSAMDISHDIAERGNEYYMENKVLYISVDGMQGKAIVSGSENYIVEFTYRDGEISNLVTLESVAITKVVIEALKKLEKSGKADLTQFPLLAHIYDMITGKITVNIPWRLFEE